MPEFASLPLAGITIDIGPSQRGAVSIFAIAILVAILITFFNNYQENDRVNSRPESAHVD